MTDIEALSKLYVPESGIFPQRRLTRSIWEEAHEREVLREGLIFSYDKDQLVTNLFQKYKNDIGLIENSVLFPALARKNKFGCMATQIGIAFPVEYEHRGDVEKIADSYGYFVSKITKEIIKNKTWDFYIMEPKYPTLFRPDEGVVFYHITRLAILPKIKKIGLTPRNSETTFKHPDNRIYLLAAKNVQFVEYFKTTLAKDKNFAPEDMVILKIDPAFSYNTDFFIDESFRHLDGKLYGVFVLKNIHPNFLIFNE